jgi:hypothetical protein
MSICSFRSRRCVVAHPEALGRQMPGSLDPPILGQGRGANRGVNRRHPGRSRRRVGEDGSATTHARRPSLPRPT